VVEKTAGVATDLILNRLGSIGGVVGPVLNFVTNSGSKLASEAQNILNKLNPLNWF
jgi:hypothetical protein